MVTELWARWEGWLRRHVPAYVEDLAPGADPEALAAAERALGTRLPEGLRSSLLVHDGAEGAWGLVGGWELMSLDSIVSVTGLMRGMVADGVFADADGPFRSDGHERISPDWWHPMWLPFVDSGSGHHFCLDLAPTPAGTVGQVILFLHDDGRRLLVAPAERATERPLAGSVRPNWELPMCGPPRGGPRIESELRGPRRRPSGPSGGGGGGPRAAARGRGVPPAATPRR